MRPDPATQFCEGWQRLSRLIAPAARKAASVRSHTVALSPHPVIKGMLCGEIVIPQRLTESWTPDALRRVAVAARRVQAHEAWCVRSKTRQCRAFITLFYRFPAVTKPDKDRRAA